MYALMVDGGDTTSLKGVFSTREQLEAVMYQLCKDARCTPEEGYLVSTPDFKADEGVEFISVHEENIDPEDWSILFTIINLDLDQELDITI